MEDIFTCIYHLRLSRDDAVALPILDRMWLIDRFVQQKEKENEAIRAARKRKH